MKLTTVLLADDHSIVRAGLRALLETAGDIHVIAEAENGQQAVTEAARLRPNVVVLDLAMPILNGVEAARQIAHDVPSAKVLILSTYSDAAHVSQAVQAGVAGYVMKESSGDELLQAVRATCNGDAFFSPAVLKYLLEQPRTSPADHSCASFGIATLPTRQAEVLQLIAEGYSTKQIGGLLSISKKTVEKHRQNLMDRLKLHKPAALTRYAVSSGVIESGRVPDCFPALPSRPQNPSRRKHKECAPKKLESCRTEFVEKKVGRNGAVRQRAEVGSRQSDCYGRVINREPLPSGI